MCLHLLWNHPDYPDPSGTFHNLPVLPNLPYMPETIPNTPGTIPVTPSNRAYAVLAIPAKLRIEPIRRRSPNITCTAKHARNVDGIDHKWLLRNSLQ